MKIAIRHMKNITRQDALVALLTKLDLHQVAHFPSLPRGTMKAKNIQARTDMFLKES